MADLVMEPVKQTEGEPCLLYTSLALMAVSGTLGLIRKRRTAKGQKKD